MQFWLNKHSEHNNVVIQYRNGLLLASCNKKSYKDIESRLQQNANPLDIFGKENLSLIPWKSIQEITSDCGDLDIHLKYKITAVQEITISFGHAHSKEQCLSNIVGLLGERLKMSSEERSATSFYLNPLLSLALAILTTVLFYKYFQSAALVFGGIWASYSLYRLIKLSKKSREINFWKIISKSEKKPSIVIQSKNHDKPQMVTVYAYMGFACLIVAVYFGAGMFIKPYELNKAKQTKSRIEAGLNNNKQAKTISKNTATQGLSPLIAALSSGNEKSAISLIRNGADLNVSHDGKTALDYALSFTLKKAAITLLENDAPSTNQQDLLSRAIDYGMDLQVIKKIVDSGANVNYTNSSGISVLATAIEADADASVVKYLLEKGASTKILINGQTPVEFAKSNGTNKLANLLSRY